MLHNLIVGSKTLDGEDGFKTAHGKEMSQTMKLLAYALQLNRPAKFACGDAGTHVDLLVTMLETAGAQGKILTKAAPALCAPR
jgi:hypothetical protein